MLPAVNTTKELPKLQNYS